MCLCVDALSLSLSVSLYLSPSLPPSPHPLLLHWLVYAQPNSLSLWVRHGFTLLSSKMGGKVSRLRSSWFFFLSVRFDLWQSQGIFFWAWEMQKANIFQDLDVLVIVVSLKCLLCVQNWCWLSESLPTKCFGKSPSAWQWPLVGQHLPSAFHISHRKQKNNLNMRNGTLKSTLFLEYFPFICLVIEDDSIWLYMKT